MTTPPNVALLGAGRMAAAMAGRLAGAGFPLVIYNRTAARGQAVADRTGAQVAPTPRAAVAGADVVISSLADDEAVRAVSTGPDGAAAGLRPGTVALETSTVDPETVRELAPRVEDRDATLLDAPVSGSVPVVERGELMIMVGGNSAALDRARPVLDAFATKIIHLGELGAGATMKLAVNGLVHAINVGLSEALVLAERAGVERSLAYEVFASSAGGAPFVAYKRAAFERPRDTPVAFSITLEAKDLDLILRLADRVGLAMPQAAANHELAARAVRQGYGEEDMSAIAAFLRDEGPPSAAAGGAGAQG